MAALFRACLRDGAPQKGAGKKIGYGGKCGTIKFWGISMGWPSLKRPGVAIRTAVEWGGGGGGPKKGQGNTTPAGRWPHPLLFRCGAT